MSSQARQTGFPVNGKAGWGSDRQPAWRGGADDVWWHPRAVAALDFVNGRALRRPTEVALASACACARAGTGYARDGSGLWQSFAANTLACIGGVGAGVYGSFTNKIRNPRGEGGVVGTIGVTNKCTARNAAPAVLVAMGTAAAFNAAGVTNMTASGGDAATRYGIVDDTVALQAIAASDPIIAAGLANGWLNGRVFKIDNSAGAVIATFYSGGLTGNTNQHVQAAYIRGGTGSFRQFTSGAGANYGSFAASGGYVRRVSSAFTPSDTGRQLVVAADAGQVLYLILFDMIEASTVAPVPTVVAGASATGALPTYMAVEQAMSGVASSFLGTGVAPNGKPYFHMGLHGTLTGGNALIVRMDALTYATASPGQAWGLDFDSSVSGGTSTGLASVKAVLRQIPSNALAESTENGLSSLPVRLLAKGVVSGASTSVYPRIAVDNLNNGAAVNAVLCIAAPKLVQIAVAGGNAGYVPAFPILPTGGVIADSGKIADDVRATSMTWFVAAGLSAGATELIAATFTHVGDGVSRPLFEYSDGTGTNFIKGAVGADKKSYIEIVSGGVLQTLTVLNAVVAEGNQAFAFGWSAAGGYVTNGAATATFGAVTLPVGLSVKRFGGSLSANSLNDILRQAQTCVPMNMTDAAVWAQVA